MSLVLNQPLDSGVLGRAPPGHRGDRGPDLVVAWWYNIGLHLRGTLLGYEQLTSTKRLLALAGNDSEARNFDPKFLIDPPEALV